MSLLIGKSQPRVRINKFIIFEMLGFVFKDFQILELLLKLSRGSYKLAVGNQDLLKRMCQEHGMYFTFGAETPLNEICQEYLSRVSLLRIRGHIQVSDDLEAIKHLQAMNPSKVVIDTLTY